jgi:hypothetical protein
MEIHEKYAENGDILLSTTTQSYTGEIEIATSTAATPDRLFPSF